MAFTVSPDFSNLFDTFQFIAINDVTLIWSLILTFFITLAVSTQGYHIRITLLPTIMVLTSFGIYTNYIVYMSAFILFITSAMSFKLLTQGIQSIANATTAVTNTVGQMGGVARIRLSTGINSNRDAIETYKRMQLAKTKQSENWLEQQRTAKKAGINQSLVLQNALKLSPTERKEEQLTALSLKKLADSQENRTFQETQRKLKEKSQRELQDELLRRDKQKAKETKAYNKQQYNALKAKERLSTQTNRSVALQQQQSNYRLDWQDSLNQLNQINYKLRNDAGINRLSREERQSLEYNRNRLNNRLEQLRELLRFTK